MALALTKGALIEINRHPDHPSMLVGLPGLTPISIKGTIRVKNSPRRHKPIFIDKVQVTLYGIDISNGRPTTTPVVKKKTVRG
ncbi:hypothetical protein HK102_004671, partial [Quaeritorhiza haematococci]